MRGKVNPVRQLDLLISSKNREWFRQHISPKQNALGTEAAQTEAVYKTNHNSCRNYRSRWRNEGQKGEIKKISLFRSKARNEQQHLSSEDF